MKNNESERKDTGGNLWHDGDAFVSVREYWRRRLLSVRFSLVWSALFAVSVVVLVCFWSVCFPLVFPHVLELSGLLFLPMQASCMCSVEGGRDAVPFRGCGCRLSPFLAFVGYVLEIFRISFGRKVPVS